MNTGEEIIDLEEVKSELSEDIQMTDAQGKEITSNIPVNPMINAMNLLKKTVHKFIRFDQAVENKGRFVSVIGKIIYIEPVDTSKTINLEDSEPQTEIEELSSDINFKTQRVALTIQNSKGQKLILQKCMLGEKVSLGDIGLFKVRTLHTDPCKEGKIYMLYISHKLLSQQDSAYLPSQKENNILTVADTMVEFFNSSHSYY